jgi:hypothetical protein
MSEKSVPDYDQDFYAWTLHNAQLLRNGRLNEIDRTNIAEELESMGKSQKRALNSRLTVLLAHLLKWRYQAGARSPSWRNTITIQRIELSELLEENPSLRPKLPGELPAAYRKARLWAANETQLDLHTFPVNCAFTVDQVLDEDFWPDHG